MLSLQAVHWDIRTRVSAYRRGRGKLTPKINRNDELIFSAPEAALPQVTSEVVTVVSTQIYGVWHHVGKFSRTSRR